jgi:hypothetical protein
MIFVDRVSVAHSDVVSKVTFKSQVEEQQDWSALTRQQLQEEIEKLIKAMEVCIVLVFSNTCYKDKENIIEFIFVLL